MDRGCVGIGADVPAWRVALGEGRLDTLDPLLTPIGDFAGVTTVWLPDPAPAGAAGPVPWSCGSSVLNLVSTIVNRRILTSPVPPQLTMPQMRSRLNALGAPDFPIRTFVRHALGTSRFVRASGEDRRDGYFVCFIPAMPGLIADHWTIIQLAGIEPVPIPACGFIIHTTLPPALNQHVYWRAEGTVDPALLAVYRHNSLGCSCPLSSLACVLGDACRHEKQFRLAHPQFQRITFGKYSSRSVLGEIVMGSNLKTISRMAPRTARLNLDGVEYLQEDALDSVWGVSQVLYTPEVYNFGNYALRTHCVVQPWRDTLVYSLGVLRIFLYFIRTCWYCLFAIYFSFVVCCFIKWRYDFESVVMYRRSSPLGYLGELLEKGISRSWDYFVSLDAKYFPPILDPATLLEWKAPLDGLYLLQMEAVVVSVLREWYTLWMLHCNRRFLDALDFVIPHACVIFFVCLALLVTGFFGRCLWHRIQTHHVKPAVVPVAYASTSGLSMTLPFLDKLQARLALKKDVDDVYVRDILMRLSSELHFNLHMPRHEIEIFVERCLTTPGKAPYIPSLNHHLCYTCQVRPIKHQKECFDCRVYRKSFKLFLEVTNIPMVHVGILGLYTRRPIIPDTRLRDLNFNRRGGLQATSFCMEWRGEQIRDLSRLYQIYDQEYPFEVCKGRLCGPMFASYRCYAFQNGDAARLAAFYGRMAPFLPFRAPIATNYGLDICDFLVAVFDLMCSLRDSTWGELVPWTRQQCLEHQRVASKRRLLAQSYVEFDNGLERRHELLKNYTSLVKGEKSLRDEYVDHYNMAKSKEVPRFISSPHPQLHAHLCQYVYPMMKRLSSIFDDSSPFTYASCMTPEQLNAKLNRQVVRKLQVVIEWDISACDSSVELLWHRLVEVTTFRAFASMTPAHRAMWLFMRQISIHTKNLKLHIENINPSGVTLTSYITSILSLLCSFLAYASCYTRKPVLDMSIEEITGAGSYVFGTSETYVAGDDGYSAVVENFAEWHTQDPAFLSWFCRAWNDLGLTVRPSKCRLFGPSQWRLATFLAMRPFWNGTSYAWGPEIARRMKTCFWQYDNTLQPVPWARGVAVSVLMAAPHVPVLSDIMKWYIAITSGPTIHSTYSHQYSPFYGYEVKGIIDQRTLSEFCADYEVTLDEYALFKEVLVSLQDPFVNLDFPFFQRILAKE